MILNKEIIFQNEIKTNEFNLVRVVDETINRQVYCILNYNGIDKYVLLWEGTEYDATDPPYSTPVITSFGRKKFKNLADLSVQEFYFKAIKTELERVMKPNGRVFIFCDDKFYPILYAVFYEWLNLGLIIWDKGKIGMGRPIRKQHELIMYANQGTTEFQKFGEITHIPSVLKVKHDSNKIHGAQKPVELIEHLVNGFSNENDLVVDLFGGSGSTAVACKNLNRNFIGFELNQIIADASVERLSSLSLKGEEKSFIKKDFTDELQFGEQM